MKNMETLYEKVKALVLEKRDGSSYKSITKEEAAKLFKVKEHQIHECFVKLNHEGILSQPIRHVSDDRWAPDRYQIKHVSENWISAIAQKDKGKIERLLKRGVSIHSSRDLHNALSVAIKEKDLSFITYILNLGFDPFFDKTFHTISLIFEQKDLEMLKLVLSFMKNPFCEDKNEETLLFNCARLFPEALPFLAEVGFDLNKKNNHKQNALIAATIEKQSKSVEFLMRQKVDIKGRDGFKKTAFMYAYENEDSKILKLFLPLHKELTRDEKKLFKKIRMQLLF